MSPHLSRTEPRGSDRFKDFSYRRLIWLKSEELFILISSVLRSLNVWHSLDELLVALLETFLFYSVGRLKWFKIHGWRTEAPSAALQPLFEEPLLNIKEAGKLALRLHKSHFLTFRLQFWNLIAENQMIDCTEITLAGVKRDLWHSLLYFDCYRQPFGLLYPWRLCFTKYCLQVTSVECTSDLLRRVCCWRAPRWVFLLLNGWGSSRRVASPVLPDAKLVVLAPVRPLPAY